MLKIKHIALIFLAIASLSLSSCGGGGGGGDDTPTPTPEEQRLIDLAGTTGVTYEAVSVTRDGEPNDEYDNFTLTLKTSTSSNTYTTTDNDPVFKSSGTWALGSSINQVILDGDSSNPVTISNFNAASGTFSLSINYTRPGGLAAGLSGTYVFNLQKQ